MALCSIDFGCNNAHLHPQAFRRRGREGVREKGGQGGVGESKRRLAESIRVGLSLLEEKFTPSSNPQASSEIGAEWPDWAELAKDTPHCRRVLPKEAADNGECFCKMFVHPPPLMAGRAPVVVVYVFVNHPPIVAFVPRRACWSEIDQSSVLFFSFLSFILLSFFFFFFFFFSFFFLLKEIMSSSIDHVEAKSNTPAVLILKCSILMTKRLKIFRRVV